jgi:hypothetical protein
MVTVEPVAKVALGVGLVKLTVGGVFVGFTLIEIAAEVVVALALSVALAVNR